ncbi:MAG: ABC transporter substrate-binding protein [Geobacteraceae bacterium]|nr:ABC transporter substrate-binding protein [Geobacteraceae bacterium]
MKRLVISLVLVMLLFPTGAEAARITDMYGHGVTLPSRITRVLGASPPVTYMVYTLDPSLLVGLNSSPDDDLRRFLRPETMKLPVVGGFGGQGKNFNAEVLLSLRPDLVLAWSPRSSTLNPRVEQALASAGIPCACVKLDNMSDYPAAYEFLGSLLGRKKRGKQLASHFRTELNKLKTFSARIPEGKRVSVYFAEEEDGLTTVSSDSVHGEALALAGGRNVYRKQSGSRRVKDRISIEQVIVLNPEVIIAQDESFFNEVYRDPRWSRIKAVRTRRVYLIPDTPFDWMDRPPSFLRLLGAKWLADVLYPRVARVNMVSETRKFYQMFFGANLSEAQVRAILKM